MEEIKIPTARQYLEEHCLKGHVSMDSVDDYDIRNDMIEFAKLHVEAALKAVIKNGTVSEPNPWQDKDYYHINEESVITAYPLTNIK